MLKSVVVAMCAVRSKNEEFYFLPTQCFDVFFFWWISEQTAIISLYSIN